VNRRRIAKGLDPFAYSILNQRWETVPNYRGPYSHRRFGHLPGAPTDDEEGHGRFANLSMMFREDDLKAMERALEKAAGEIEGE